jgi:hypothetical protein
VLASTAGAAARATGAEPASADALKSALAQALQQRGYEIELDVGASRFRCDIAVRPKQSSGTPVAILVDSEAFYALGTSDERFRLRPAILGSFGWKVELVLGKDWLADSEAVLQRIEAALSAGNQVEEPSANGPTASAGTSGASPAGLHDPQQKR